ncbi:unnamed protein product [Absidia cylindrospora]
MVDPEKSHSDHKVVLSTYSGTNANSWLKKFNKASQINRLTDQEKLDRVPFYVPDAIGDWVHGKDFVESFEGSYGLKSSKVELLSKLLSIQQSPSESPAPLETTSLILSIPKRPMVFVQSFVSGFANATLKQLMIDKLNASSTVDKVVKVFSLLITHHCGLSPTQPVEQPVPALDTKIDSMIQGMTTMFSKMDTFLSQTNLAASGSGSRKPKCSNCKSPDHMSQTCPLPCSQLTSTINIRVRRLLRPVPSQVSDAQAIDVAALVNIPVYNLSLAQIASHPTWRAQIKDALTKPKDSSLTQNSAPVENRAP